MLRPVSEHSQKAEQHLNPHNKTFYQHSRRPGNKGQQLGICCQAAPISNTRFRLTVSLNLVGLSCYFGGFVLLLCICIFHVT